MINISIYKKHCQTNNNLNTIYNFNESSENEEKIELFKYIKNLKIPLTTPYIDFLIQDDYYFFISENFGISLDTLIKQKNISKSFFSFNKIITITYQILKCISYLEKENIFLRSLEPKFIFIDEKKNGVQISNYSIDAMFSPNEIAYLHEIKYLPPELIFYPEKTPISSSVIFSLGIILLEILIDGSNFCFFQNFQNFLNSDEFIQDYIDILKKYYDDSLIVQNSQNINYKTEKGKELLEYFLNGEFIKDKATILKEKQEFIELITECLVVNCDKRKNASDLLQLSIFKNEKLEINWDFTILPIEKESLINKVKDREDINKKIKSPSSKDNYEILTNICKINIIDYLYRINLIKYEAPILKVPDYVSGLSYKNIKPQKVKYRLKYINSINLTFPKDYNDSKEIEQNLFGIYFKGMVGKPKEMITKDILSYLKLKNLLCSFLFQKENNSLNNELVVEIKKNISFPSSLRLIAYCFLLGIDYFNDRDNLNLLYSFKFKEYITETSSSKFVLMMNKILNGIFVNNQNLFYVQGMEKVLSPLIYLANHDIEISYVLFEKFVIKLLIQFYNEKDKTTKDLKFNHLIIERLLLYFDPKYYIHLSNKDLFIDEYLNEMILSLFAQNFSNEKIFLIWDSLLIQKLNIMYIIIVQIFLLYKKEFSVLKKEDIIPRFKFRFDELNIEQLLELSVSMYKNTPQSFLPIYHDYNEEVIAELQQNEFFKNRWWDMRNFYTDEIKAPVMAVDDIVKFYDQITFVDIRKSITDNLKVKGAITFTDNIEDIVENDEEDSPSIKQIKKANEMNKIIVLIGNKDTVYDKIIIVLANKDIKNLCVLQGGIDVIQLEEKSLLL